MLKLENITGGYLPGSPILNGISMEVAKGEVVGIIGLNGCGKSTLGKAIMNMLPYRTGSIWFEGKDISTVSPYEMQHSGISMIMQGGRIFKNMSIGEHIQLVTNEESIASLKKKFKEVEDLTGITKFTTDTIWKQKGSSLSGGEKQQLVLMMALLQKPKLLILDEISAGLSPDNLKITIDVISRVKDQNNFGILLIEQNLRIATQLSNRMVLIERGIIDHTFLIDENFDFNTLNENIFN
jgi:ABC-type branched-subunit amino acid transport system ATPase component